MSNLKKVTRLIKKATKKEQQDIVNYHYSVEQVKQQKKSNDLMKYQRKYPNYLEICELDLIAENSSNILTNFLNDRPIDIFINNAGIIGDSNQNFLIPQDLRFHQDLKKK